ncbi:MAG: cytochrome c [Deltaproteobacteria bacterium]|nr:cytochrome c [Deltaproteobacteria bacterium]
MNSTPTRAAITAALLALAGCSGGDGGEPDTAVTRGERTYKNVCLACHAADPSLDGSLGPAIAGSSRELIEARVLHASYPEGYAPKRNSQAMPKFPHLEEAVGDLTAYLNQ